VLLGSAHTLHNNSLSIVDGLGGLVFSEKEGQCAYNEYRAAAYPADNRFHRSADGQRYLFAVPVPGTDWTLYRAVRTDELQRDVSKQLFDMAAIAIVAIAVGILLAFWVSLEITRPISDLLAVMGAVKDNNFKSRFSTKRQDEFGALGEAFNRMLDEIKTLIDNVYTLDYKKKAAELQALQSQINPHFLSNTLESIKMSAKLSGDDQTARMLTLLGKLLRYAQNAGMAHASVRDEVEHTRNYIDLQNIRFENKFRLVVVLDDDLLDLKMFRLSFQPIIENAIYHALEDKDGMCTIVISGWADASGVYFDFQDDGKGIGAVQLEDINRYLEDAVSDTVGPRGIGLKNIQQRLHLYFGQQSGMRLSSSEPTGCRVTIRLPPKERLNQIILREMSEGGSYD